MRTLLSGLPEAIKAPLRHTENAIKTLPYHGKGRYCPVCNRSSRRFMPYGFVPREEAQCVHCGALERHRLLWLFLKKNTDLFDGKVKKMLHVAPEPCFESIFRAQLGSGYLTADLLNPKAMVKMDISDIKYPDESFDVIYCSHVLEHIPDDKKGMKEFYRVLKNSGWAILNVPITRDITYEDSSIIDPKERLKAFGQEDHVRCYGPDYVERLRDTGFTVKVSERSDVADKDESVRMGLTRSSGLIYYCTK